MNRLAAALAFGMLALFSSIVTTGGSECDDQGQNCLACVDYEAPAVGHVYNCWEQQPT